MGTTISINGKVIDLSRTSCESVFTAEADLIECEIAKSNMLLGREES